MTPNPTLRAFSSPPKRGRQTACRGMEGHPDSSRDRAALPMLTELPRHPPEFQSDAGSHQYRPDPDDPGRLVCDCRGGHGHRDPDKHAIVPGRLGAAHLRRVLLALARRGDLDPRFLPNLADRHHGGERRTTMDINRVQLFGRVGRDPEVCFTTAGTALCSLSVATTETWKQNGQERKDTQRHNVVAWGKLAARLGEVLAKGTFVFVEGKLTTDTYEKNGEKRYATKVVALVCFPLATPGRTEPQTRDGATATAAAVERDEDTPF